MYIVRWKRSALNRMTELWLDAADRSAITDAVAEIDRLLANNPLHAGESRSEQDRVLFVPPLGVFFEVGGTSHVVQVLRVWTF